MGRPHTNLIKLDFPSARSRGLKLQSLRPNFLQKPQTHAGPGPSLFLQRARAATSSAWRWSGAIVYIVTLLARTSTRVEHSDSPPLHVANPGDAVPHRHRPTDRPRNRARAKGLTELFALGTARALSIHLGTPRPSRCVSACGPKKETGQRLKQ